MLHVYPYEHHISSDGVDFQIILSERKLCAVGRINFIFRYKEKKRKINIFKYIKIEKGRKKERRREINITIMDL